MKLVVVFIGLIMVLPVVVAVGVLVPQELSDDSSQYFKVGSERDITFSIKGDAQTHDVTFFINVVNEEGTYLKFNNEKAYTKNIFLTAYEEEEVLVTIEGTQKYDAGDWLDVRYGFMYTAEANQSGVGMEQIVANTFQARVRCTTCTNPPSDEGGSARGSGGGGGGGGTGIIPYTSNGTESTSETATSPLFSPETVQLTDVNAQTTAVTEGQVPIGFATSEAKDARKSAGAITVQNGRLSLLLVLGLLVTMMVLETAAIRVIKRGKDE